MATPSIASNPAAQQPDLDSRPAPHFSRFEWYCADLKDANISGREFADLASLTRNLAKGIAVVVAMVELDNTLDGSDDATLLGVQDRSDLLRFAIASADLLGDHALRVMERQHDICEKAQQHGGRHE